MKNASWQDCSHVVEEQLTAQQGKQALQEGGSSPKKLSEGERQVVEKLDLIDFIHRIDNRQCILRNVA